MTVARPRLDPSLTHCSPAFRQSLSSCLGLVLGHWNCEPRWEVRVCDTEQKLPPVFHASPPQTQRARWTDTQMKAPMGPPTRMLKGSSLTNARLCPHTRVHAHTHAHTHTEPCEKLEECFKCPNTQNSVVSMFSKTFIYLYTLFKSHYHPHSFWKEKF